MGKTLLSRISMVLKNSTNTASDGYNKDNFENRELSFAIFQKVNGANRQSQLSQIFDLQTRETVSQRTETSEINFEV
jgi:hypothetical protein